MFWKQLNRWLQQVFLGAKPVGALCEVKQPPITGTYKLHHQPCESPLNVSNTHTLTVQGLAKPSVASFWR